MRGRYAYRYFAPHPPGYRRGHMGRRLFVAFTFVIFGTAIFASLVGSAIVSAGRSHWERSGLNTFVASQFETAWEKPEARQALASSLSSSIRGGVVVRDASGPVLTSSGISCARPEVVKVTRQGTELGTVELCPQSPEGTIWRWFGIFIAPVIGLWIISGAVARRLARPLAELVRVTESLGNGDLTTRAHLSRPGHWEIAALARSINRMADRIEKQITDQRHLLAAVSHEIRAPLARIRVLTELAKSRRDQPEILDDLDREVTGIDELVGNLLANSRLDFSAVAIRELEAKEIAKEALRRAGLSADLLTAAASNASFEGDPTLLGRALANLADNAQRHGRGLQSLNVTADEQSVAFEFLDSGPGLPANFEERVFVPFGQKQKNGGGTSDSLGIGLSIVKRVAEAHQGRVVLKNRATGGTVVRLEIPRRHAHRD